MLKNTSVVPLFFLSFAATVSADWNAEKIHEVSGFQIPECVVIDEARGTAYVSNVNAAREGKGYDRFWSHDSYPFISRFSLPEPDSAPIWQKSNADFRFSGPKGMCILGDSLYVTDIDRVLRFPLDGKQPPKVIPVPGAKKLNDMASDGKFAYVTDSGAGKCYRLHPRGNHEEILAPVGINGITFSGDKMYGVSWALRDIYELDPEGVKPPRAFGLTDYFKTPDGIEVLQDGTFVVSDSEGNQVLAVSADGRSVAKLVMPLAPADIGIDRKRGLLFVPRFFDSRVNVYRLKNN